METPPRPRGRRGTVPDAHQQALFVDLLMDGVRRDQAARAVGSTSTRFSSLQRRDRAFDDLVREAVELGRPEYHHQLRRTLDGIATNPRHPGQLRAAITLAEAHLPEFEHKRTTRIGNAPGEVLELGANARITPEALAALSDEELARLQELKEMEKRLAAGAPLRAIEGGQG